MAYAHKVKRLTFSGTCFGGTEIWSTGLFLGSPTADVSNASQAEVDLYAARWSTFFGLLANQFSSHYITTQTKLSVLDTAGHPDPLNTVYNTALVTPGGLSTAIYPPQISLVASLRATAVHGLATHGRMYLPGVASAIDITTGKLPSSQQGTLATAFQTFIKGLNTDAPVGDQVALCSKGRTLPTVLAGVTQLVTHIEVGDVFDTQRRRRNGLSESYVNKTIP